MTQVLHYSENDYYNGPSLCRGGDAKPTYPRTVPERMRKEVTCPECIEIDRTLPVPAPSHVETQAANAVLRQVATCCYKDCTSLWTVERRDTFHNVYRFCPYHDGMVFGPGGLSERFVAQMIKLHPREDS